MNDIVNMENIGENLVFPLKTYPLVFALFLAHASGDIVENGGFEAGKRSYPPSIKRDEIMENGWLLGKKEKFLKTGLAKIISYQASLPGSVEVARVMYGALATQVFDWEYCRLSVIFEL